MAIESPDFLDYKITDVESYATILRGADMEISQLEPGRLQGHHLRVGLPDGLLSWVVTNLPLRGRGRFPSGIRTLSVVVKAAGNSLQHGVEVGSGSFFHHGPGAEHDGIYGRDFSVVCLCLREELFADTVRIEYPELSELPNQNWSIFKVGGGKMQEALHQFEQAAIIVKTDEMVRQSSIAMSVMQSDLQAIFLEALADGATSPPNQPVSHSVALVRRAEELARNTSNNNYGQPLSVSDLCAVCNVPRRTLNLAFQQVLGMGPITYLRRLRLNQARRLLRQPLAKGAPKSVSEIALDHGFWHLGRFSTQFRELFGTSPSDSRQPSRNSIRS